METLSISKFKATCLRVIERVKRTGETVLITKRGLPVAQVVPPPAPPSSKKSAFGAMAGTAREIADVVEPADEDAWEALR